MYINVNFFAIFFESRLRNENQIVIHESRSASVMFYILFTKPSYPKARPDTHHYVVLGL